jgi:hypothetical protein
MSDWRDAQWQRDYNAAVEELNGRAPERKLLTILDDPLEATFAEVPRYAPCSQEPFNVRGERQVLGTIDPKDFDPVGYRQAILARTTTRRTATPGVREVRFLGQACGQVAKSPYQAFIWIASTNRRQPFSSLADAAVEVARTFIEGGAA